MDAFDYSVVMEWDNPRTGGANRALEAFRRVGEQMRSAPGAGEIVVVYADDIVDGIELRETLESIAKGLALRCVATPDLRYYQLKDAGVRAARGRIVVVLDSDLLVEPGSLEVMLAALERPEVQFVCGNAYLDCESFLDRSFALCWGFPLRLDPRLPRVEQRQFYANSYAASRELLMRFPFGEDGERHRELCNDVARRLWEQGIAIWLEPSAQGAHPRPKPFFERALQQGRDRAATLRRTRTGTRAFFRLLSWYTKRLFRGSARIVRGRRSVGLTPFTLPAALVVCWTYYTVAWLAGAATFTVSQERSRVV